MWNGNLIMVKEGQLITGRNELVKATGIPGTTIERILQMFENEHQIGQQKNNKYRLITIVNWDEHQNRTPERTTSGQQADTNKNDKKEKNTSAQEDLPREVFIQEEEENTPSKKKPKYPHRKEVSQWFPNPEPSWLIDTTQCQHMELLFKRGEEKVRGILKFVAQHKDDEFFPKVVKPSDLERKWNDIAAYRV